MNKMPIVSVIIPCYNYGRYLDVAVDSVLNQTYQEFEIIIVNDGSTDGYTNDLLREYRRPKSRVFHTKNQGVSAARNYGIDQSAGEYILPLVPDDKIGPTYLEKAVKIFDTDPQIGIVYSKVNMFGNESGDQNWPDYSKEEMLFRNVIFNSALFQKRTGFRLENTKQIFSTPVKTGTYGCQYWNSELKYIKYRKCCIIIENIPAISEA